MTIKSGNKTVDWKVIKDVKEDGIPLSKKNLKIGIKGFDFNKITIKSGTKGNCRRISLLQLLIHLWPGDWKEQLKMLNTLIVEDNKQEKNL